MLNRLDEHGKVFTERVRKIGVEVEILTLHGQIHGQLHVQPGQRVKDMLNSKEEQFLAVTSATICKNGATEAQEVHFLAINKEHIIAVIPVDEHKSVSLDDVYAY